jgi:hypothetical protein
MSDLNPNRFNNASITQLTAKQVLTDTFVTAIATMSNPLLIVLQNQQHDSPSEGYIQFTVRGAGSAKTGYASYSNVGLATADIYVPLGTGWGLSDAIHAVIEDAFLDKAWEFNVMSITSVVPNDVGQQGGYYLTQVDIAYRYDHKV